MAEPENHTLHLLREIRAAIAGLESRVEGKHDSLEAKMDRNHEELKKRMDSLRQAINGESVLGRYAAAEVEDRLAAIEHRLTALEQRSGS